MRTNLKLFVSVILLAAVIATFGQEKQFSGTGEQSSSVTDSGLVKVSVMYPFAEGKRFDMDYYQTKHMPMVAKFLGSTLIKYTIEKGLASGIPNQPLPFVAIGTFYVRSLEDYQIAIGPNRAAIRADFANYTTITPVILVSSVIR